ncbi:ABC transporter ATP-binding protein [Sporosarcina sp. FSL K6-1522]|uniref:ABC transporter ATP-binding protein n=1 Tax=Sporosarcina sp. FSL K6-1522 TaxID=2921554 RepID=UPI003159E302
METIMELRAITKRYNGKEVIGKASFSIRTNQIVALIGKNGSGKSTLLKMIAGLEKPDDGEIHKPIQSLKIGYVPEIPPVDILFTPEEYLMHMGRIRGIGKQQLHQRIDSLLESFHLQDVRKTRIIDFSKGMKQKVTIMQAMLEKPNLLILDEPLSGLDPKAQADLEAILLQLKERGLGVILTCHETRLLENLVDRALLIKNQQVIQMDALHKSDVHKDRFIFEICIDKSLEAILPFIEIQRESSLNTKVNEVEAIVNREYTNQVLVELLKKDASIRLVAPIYGVKGEFQHYF